MSAPDIRFRRMTRVDLAAVLRIEAEAEGHPWSREAFQRYLSQQGVLGEVLESDGEVCGFYLVELKPERVHVLNLAVAESFRRRGLGTAILARIDDVARERERPLVELEVRESNLGAQLLYKKCGYRAVEILRAHYESEDGYLLRHEPQSELAQP